MAQNREFSNLLRNIYRRIPREHTTVRSRWSLRRPEGTISAALRAGGARSSYVRRSSGNRPWLVLGREDQGMFRERYPWMFLLGGVLIGLVISGRFRLEAQDRAQPIRRDPGQTKVGRVMEPPPPARGGERSDDAPVRREPAQPEPVSVQD